MVKRRILSGMQPTGKAHLGNFAGALQNWVRLQEECDCFYCIVDWHALTTQYDSTEEIRESIVELGIDWLACGLDPGRSTLFIQSRVPEHAELHLLFSMITPLPWLERVPSYKEKQEQIVDRDINTYGFLGYPLLQAADILIYRADAVPVGEDQVPHIELTREIARRFNNLYRPIFPEPQSLLTSVPKLPGTDGRKMSKSYGNTITLSDPPDEVKRTVRMMVTDPARKTRQDPGNPDICPVGDYHKVFSDKKRVAEVDQGCRTAGIGCVDCKMWLFESLQKVMAPIYERRREYDGRKTEVVAILEEGSRRARAVAAETMSQVRDAMKI